jgi:hypothetical protein
MNAKREEIRERTIYYIREQNDYDTKVFFEFISCVKPDAKTNAERMFSNTMSQLSISGGCYLTLGI